MIVVVDREYRYRLANRAFLNYRGLEREKLLGRSIPEVLDQTVFDRFIKVKLDDCFEGRVVKYELKYDYSSQGERDLLISYFPVEGPAGVDRAVCILQDITDRKRAEEELRRLSSLLLCAQDEKRRSIARDLHDSTGQNLVVFNTGPTSDYNLYTQRTDGSSLALIGHGQGLSLSFDSKWAAAADPIHLQQLRIIPTGVGEARTLSAPPGLNYMAAIWMPDSTHVLVTAKAAGHAPATYLQDVNTGSARQITGEGKYAVANYPGSMSVSPDGKYCVTTDGGNHYWIQPIDPGEPRELKGMLEGDFPLEWHNGSENIFLGRKVGADAVDVYDFNVATGQHKLWTHFSPTDKTAMVGMYHPLITPDGAHSLYAVKRLYSTLFVAKGIQ